jgi:hypothetical protein
MINLDYNKEILLRHAKYFKEPEYYCAISDELKSLIKLIEDFNYIKIERFTETIAQSTLKIYYQKIQV